MNSPYELLTGLALLREKKRRSEQAGDSRLNAWSALVVRMGSKTCVVQQSDVEEILTQDKLTRVTGVAPWVAGLGFFQGKLLNVIDGQQVFAADEAIAANRLTAIRILVVRGEKEWFGLKVSELVGIRHVWSDNVSPAVSQQNIHPDYVEQWIRMEEQVLPVLKLKQLAKDLEYAGAAALEQPATEPVKN